ncbi:extracellular solute-binding protein [Streptomyces sp. SID7805]|nr:extracellular solute-binding protein [Streptomyces sp. SID7805]
MAGTAIGCTTSPTGGSSSGAKITLNVWSHAYGEAGTQQALTRCATEFTKANPDIAVKVTWVPGDYPAKLNASLLTAAAPDVFEHGDFTQGLARRGQVAALDAQYGSAKDDFNQGDRDLVTVDGKLYGVKMVDDVQMLYYRKSALAKAGITPPTTFDALVTAARTLTTKKSKGLFVGNDGVGEIPALSVFSNRGELVADGKIAFASPQAVEAVTALKRLHDDKSLLMGFTTAPHRRRHRPHRPQRLTRTFGSTTPDRRSGRAAPPSTPRLGGQHHEIDQPQFHRPERHRAGTVRRPGHGGTLCRPDARHDVGRRLRRHHHHRDDRAHRGAARRVLARTAEHARSVHRRRRRQPLQAQGRQLVRRPGHLGGQRRRQRRDQPPGGPEVEQHPARPGPCSDGADPRRLPRARPQHHPSALRRGHDQGHHGGP